MQLSHFFTATKTCPSDYTYSKLLACMSTTKFALASYTQ